MLLVVQMEILMLINPTLKISTLIVIFNVEGTAHDF